MKFCGASRRQDGKSVNDDAFACLGNYAFLMDGAGACGGRAQRLMEIVKRQGNQAHLQQLVTLLNFHAISLGLESTLLAVHIQDEVLTGVSIGNNTVHLLRDGRLTRLNETTRRRLGRPNPDVHYFSAALKRYDCVVLCSDGVVLDAYRFSQILQRYLLRPTEMPEAVLAAQKDHSDDATVVCRSI